MRVVFLLLVASCAACAALVRRGPPRLRGGRAPLLSGAPHGFFRFRKLDHVVLRCKSVQTMQRWYIDVLGADAEWLDRFDGALSHVRVGDALIDLVSHSCPFAFADGEPDPRTSTLDHIAVSVEDYDVEAAKEYLTSRGAEIITFGSRFGADGHGFSLYTRDPEGNVVELKSRQSTLESAPAE